MDILERLRDPLRRYGDDCYEAADEIERLRDQIFQFKNATPQILSSYNETLKNYVNNTELILQEVREENERLREALKFYADPENYEFKIGDTAVMPNVEYCEVLGDQGMAARAALKGDE